MNPPRGVLKNSETCRASSGPLRRTSAASCWARVRRFHRASSDLAASSAARAASPALRRTANSSSTYGQGGQGGARAAGVAYVCQYVPMCVNKKSINYNGNECHREVG